MVKKHIRKASKKISAKKKNKSKTLKRNINHAEKYYQLNQGWPYLDDLKNLVFKNISAIFPKIERGLV